MTALEKTMNSIRPRLKDIAPQTFWMSLAFASFNIFVGCFAANGVILYRLQLLGAVPIRVWGVIFLLLGISILFSLLINNWKMTRGLHMVGVAVKGTWLLEALAAWTVGQSPFPFFVWCFMCIVQIIVYYYFTPRIGNAK